MNFFIQWSIFEVINWIVVLLIVHFALKEKKKKNGGKS